MKKIVGILGVVSLLASCNQGGINKNASLSTEMDSVSYSLGVLMSSDLTRIPFVDSLNQDLILSGIASGIEKDAEQKITKEDAMRIWRAYGKKYQEEAKKKAEEATQKNKEAGKKFLEENKGKAGVITTESGLQYKIDKQGEGKLPKKGEIAVVNYTGTLLDGTEFDSSLGKDRKPFEFEVGKGRVIPGWDEALQKMPVGSKWKLFIPSELAYGDRAIPKIPAGSTLIFDVEVLDVKPAPVKK